MKLQNRTGRLSRRQNVYAYAFLAPWVIGLIAFFLLFACLRMITLGDEETQPEKEDKIGGWWQKIKNMSEEINK